MSEGHEGQLHRLVSQYGDEQETVYSVELYLLRRIAQAGSDLVKARGWPEFCNACGGLEGLYAAHDEAVARYEQWVSDGEG